MKECQSEMGLYKPPLPTPPVSDPDNSPTGSSPSLFSQL